MQQFYSTGAKNALLTTKALRELISGKVIRLYSGTPPASADAALSGNTLLNTISSGGTGAGLELEATVTSPGVIEKAAAQTWQGTAVATGTVTFFRIVDPSDAGTASTTAERIQGDAALAGAIFNISNLTITESATDTINYAVFAFGS